MGKNIPPETLAPPAIDRRLGIPLYLQIAEAVKKLLRALPPGTSLPPERTLCARFGVSRMTLREACEILEREGLIERHQGRGAFVAPPRMRKQQYEMRSFTEEILARGSVPSSKLLSFDLVKPSVSVREFFSLSETEAIYEIRRLRFSDKVPMALEAVQIPCSLCPNLGRFNLGEDSLYRILKDEYGLRIGHCVEELCAVAPTAEQRKLLELPRKVPALLIKRQSYSTNDAPLEIAITTYRGDRYRAVVHAVRSS